MSRFFRRNIITCMCILIVLSVLIYLLISIQSYTSNNQVLVRIESGRYVMMSEAEASRRNAAAEILTSSKKEGTSPHNLPPSQKKTISNNVIRTTTTFNPHVHNIDTQNGEDSIVAHHIPAPSTTIKPPSSRCSTYERASFTDEICLGEDRQVYFEHTHNYTCLLRGTYLQRTRARGGPLCVCRTGWYGPECSMPEVVFRSEDYPRQYATSIAKPPRRMIYAMPFNNEFDLLEAKVITLLDVVDLFIIVESNYTAAGNPKDTALLNRFQAGFLSEYLLSRVLYLPLSYFPSYAYANGWIIDALLRNHVGEQGLDKILDLRDDDILVMQDTDELPLPETLLFLKLHHSYTEPIGFHLKHTVFGFYWQGWDKVSNIFGACSIRMLLDVYDKQPYNLRNAPNAMENNVLGVALYKRKHGGRIHAWSFGSHELPAGWHCSWCLAPEGIQYKLLSSHQGDFPRWGSITEKTKLPYIKDLMQKGKWFDDNITMKRIFPNETFYAPQFFLDHHDVYRYVLEAEYLNHRGSS